MIDIDIKNSLEKITNFSPYAISLPVTHQEGITYNCISDPYMESGLADPIVIMARFQISIYLINNYSKLLKMDKAIQEEWLKLKHVKLDNTYVEYVEKGSFVRSKELLTDNRYRYSLVRDYLFYYQE